MLTVKQAQENISQGAEASSLVKQLVDIEILYLLTFSPKSGYELRKQLLNWFKINVSYRNVVSSSAFTGKDRLHNRQVATKVRVGTIEKVHIQFDSSWHRSLEGKC